MAHPFRKQLSPLLLALLLLPLLVFAPLAPRVAEAGSFAYDGALSNNWGGGDGFATWAYSGEVHVATAVAASELLFAVGDYESPPGTLALHFQAVDRNGEIRGDRSCRDSTGDFGVFTDESRGETAILDSSGNLLVGGWMTFLADTRTHALLARYEIDQTGCTLDESFSGDGFRLFDGFTYCDTESCAIVGLAEIRPETGAVGAPRIVALLRSSVTATTFRFFLLGLTASGALDTTFGSGTSAVREINPSGLGTLRAQAELAVDDQGKILVLVTRIEPGTTFDLDVVALRYSAGGDIDTSFSGDGVLPIEDGGFNDMGDPTAADLLSRSEPGVFFATSRSGSSDTDLARVDPDGGVSSFDLPNAIAGQIVAQGDHRLLMAAEFGSIDAFRSWRYEVTPSSYELDPTFSSGDYESYDIDLGGGSGQEIVDFVTWAGRPVVVGTAFDSTGSGVGFLMRAENSYMFVDGFEGGNTARWWGY